MGRCTFRGRKPEEQGEEEEKRTFGERIFRVTSMEGETWEENRKKANFDGFGLIDPTN